MAVAYDASTKSHTGIIGSVLEASFSWTHTPVGTPAGVLVFVMQDHSATDKATSVTYGGTTVPPVTGGFAAYATGARACKAFFLGTGVPTGTQTVVVNRTNDTTVLFGVVVTVTSEAAVDPEVYLPGMVLQQGNTTLAEQSVSDGSTGDDSMRFGGLSSALNSTASAGANSTLLKTIDFGASVAEAVRSTSAGQGSLPVGFSSGTSAALAAVYLAVRPTLPVTLVSATPGHVTMTGITPTVTKTRPVVPGAITLTGAAPTVRRASPVTPGVMTLVGQTVIVGGAGTFFVDPNRGATWSDTDAQWSSLVSVWSSADVVASIVLAGQEIAQPVSILVTTGAITHAGAAVAVSRTSAVTSGAVTFAGQDAFIGASGFLVDVAGAITLSGADVAFSLPVLVIPGAVAFAGVVIVTRRTQAAEPGIIALQGASSIVTAATGEATQPRDLTHLVPAPDWRRTGLHKLRRDTGLLRR